MAKIGYQEIPVQLLTPAVMAREIVKAKPLTIEEKKRYNANGIDIVAIPYIGKPFVATKSDIISSYTYLSGHKIDIRGWENSKIYILMRNTNRNVLVMRIPENNTVDVNGVEHGNDAYGEYMIYYANPDGTIDRSTLSFVRADLFRKMCYIPANDVIMRNRGNGNTGGEFQIPTHTRERLSNMNMGNPLIHRYREDTNNAQSFSNNQFNSPVNNRTSGKIVVIAQIIDEYGHRIGFVLSNGNSKKAINLQTALSLCQQKKIANLEIVPKNGDVYFRGNGISLDNLEKVYR